MAGFYTSIASLRTIPERETPAQMVVVQKLSSQALLAMAQAAPESIKSYAGKIELLNVPLLSPKDFSAIPME